MLRAGIQVPLGEKWKEISALLPASGVSLHHCLTFHSSNANISDQPWCSLALHLRNERAKAILGNGNYYVSHLDDMKYSPVIYEV